MDVKKVTRLFKLSMAAGLLIPLFATLSCEVGLGESVDTAAPSVTITYPPVGAVIMEDFVLAGTYKDDKGIEEVSVTIKGTGLDNSDMELGPYKAEFDKESWSIRLNQKTERSAYNGYPIKDGPIEITVAVRDGANHITTEKLSVDIDNSAPVLIMSKPLSTAADESSTSFGRVFKLTGDIYDLHQSDGITVDFKYALNNGGSLGEIKSLEGYSINSSMTDDSPLIIAQYYTEAEAGNDEGKKKNRNNYLALYGTDADDGNGNTKDKEFYCGTILTDCARIYQNPSDRTGVAKGNSTDEYYINSNDFYNELQSESGTRNAGKNYEVTATKLGKMFNGTGNDYSVDEKNAIIEVLHATGNHAPSKDLDPSKSSKFLINPDNSPMWNVSGYEQGFTGGTKNNSLANDDTGFRDLAQGSSITFNINAGKDKTLIKPETVSIKLKRYTSYENYKNGVAEDDEIVLLNKGDWSANDASTALSEQFTPTGGDRILKAGEFFVFVADGVDRSNNEIVGLGGLVYGFMVKRAETPPEIYDTKTKESGETLTIDEKSGGFISGEKAVEISGRVKMIGQEFAAENPIEVTYTCTDVTDSNNVKTAEQLGFVPVIQKSEIGVDEEDFANWKVTFAGTLCPAVPGKYKITATVTVKNGMDVTSVPEKINFYIDNKKPEVNNAQIEPYVADGENKTVNGKVKFSASIKDNNEIADAGVSSWRVLSGDDVIASGTIENADFATDAIDTTEIVNNNTKGKKLKIEVEAYDKVGNKNLASFEYLIDQTKDAPVIAPGNYDESLSADGIVVGNNLFGKSSNNLIYITVTDDDGVNDIKIYKRFASSTNEDDFELYKSWTGISSLSKAVQIDTGDDVFDDGKKYQIRIVTSDCKGETAFASNNQEFYIGVSSGAPSISRTTADNPWIGSGLDYPVVGSVDPKTKKIIRHESQNASDTGVELSYTEGDTAWSDIINATEGKTVYYFAYDEFGQKSAAQFTYKIDERIPTIAEDWSLEDKWYNSNSVKFEIPLSDTFLKAEGGNPEKILDENNSSGLKTIQYKIESGSLENMSLSGKYDTSKYLNQYEYYKTTLDFASLGDGEHKVSVYATDGAGNELKKENAYTFKIDTVAPMITEQKLYKGGVVFTGTINKAHYDAMTAENPVAISIRASVSDANGDLSVSGIKSVKLYEGTKLITTASDLSSPEFKFVPADLSDGKHTFTIVAEDNAGNSKTSDSIIVEVDTEKPGITLSGMTPTVLVGTEDRVNGEITFTGTVTDTSALGSEIKWNIDGNAVTGSGLNGTIAIPSTAGTYYGWKIENFDTTKLSDVNDESDVNNGKHKLNISVLDKAGNVKEFTSDDFIVDQETDKPVIDFSNLSEDSNVFGSDGSKEIKFTVNEDDLIKSIMVFIDGSNTASYSYEPSVADRKSSTTVKLDVTATEADVTNGKIVLAEGNHTIVVAVEDDKILNGDKAVKTASQTFIVDNKAPEIDEGGVGVTGVVTNAKVTLKGTASDTWELDKVEITDSLNTSSKWTPAVSSSDGTWTHEIELGNADNKLSDGKHTIKITAYDKSGKSSSIERTVQIDTEKPAFEKFNTDDTRIPNISTPSWVKTKDGSVENWYKSQNIEIKTKTSDAGTGVAKVQWKEKDSAEFYSLNVDSTDKNKWTGTMILSKQGSNEITYRVTDAAGNYAEVEEIIYVDTVAPADPELYSVDGVLKADVGTKLVNGGTVIVLVSAADKFDVGKEADSTGVKEVTVSKIGSTSKADKITPATTKNADGYYEIVIPQNALETGMVAVKVTDNAGNTSESQLFQMMLDNVKPKVKVNQLSDADASASGIQVNKKISISGTSSDNNTLETPAAYSRANPGNMPVFDYSTDNGVTWKPLEVEFTSDSSAYSWTTKPLDTSLSTGPFGSVSDGTKVKIRAAVTDVAKNPSYTVSGDNTITYPADSITEFIVDQNTDRPVIKITSPNSLTGMTTDNHIWQKNLNYISGTITDDDGVVASLKYSTDDGSSWQSVEASTGSWTIENIEDGKYGLLFRVVDKEDTAFNTTGENNLSLIRLTDGNNDFNNTPFYVAVDNNSPKAENIQFDLYSAKAADWDTSNIAVSDIDTKTFGGDTTKFRVHLKATDANGIANVNMTANGSEYGFTHPSSGDNTDIWTSEEITVKAGEDADSKWVSGTYGLKIVVTDGAGISTVENVSILVDNDPPTVTKSSPADDKENSGLSVNAFGTVIGTKYLWYAVSPSGTVKPSTGTAITGWTGYDVALNGTKTPKNDGSIGGDGFTPVYKPFRECVNGGALQAFPGSEWKLVFDGVDDSALTSTHTARVNKWLVDTCITEDVDIYGNAFTTCVDLYLWIMAEDEAGNVSETPCKIVVDPQGGRPKAEISSPDADGTKVTGKVRVMGSAEDDVNVQTVWVQFTSTQHNLKDWVTTGKTYGTVASDNTFAITKNDLDYMAAAGMDVYNIKKYKYTLESGESQVAKWAVDDSLGEGEYASDYAALATFTGTTWNLKVNQNGEFAPVLDGDGNPTTNTVAFRVYAYDGEFLSIAQTRTMVFDTESPEISNLALVQYDSSNNVVAQRTYKEDMFIKGTWYLEGTVKDDTVNDLDILGREIIKNGMINGSTLATGLVKNTPASVTGADATITLIDNTEINGEPYYTYKFSVKLDASAMEDCGNFSGKIEAEDQAGHTAQAVKININVDNKVPEILAYKTGDKINEKYNINPLIQNEDGFYTFGSQVTENSVTTGGRTYNQSGFARVAFYFMRRNSGTNKLNQYLYDIMRDKTDDKNRINVSGAEPAKWVFEDGLYWRKKTIGITSSRRNVITGTFDTTEIRVGSLVKINGAYYTVTSNGVSQLELSEEVPGSATENITGLFAIAQVVDHLVQETAGKTKITNDAGGINGYFNDNINDDGDCMIESVKKTGATWTWDVSVNSKNIPDGPIELHYVVFDEAGNYTIEVVGNSDSYAALDYENTDSKLIRYRKDSIAIANNAPRLAKIFLGTDLDGSGKYEEDEFVEYNVLDRTGKLKSDVTIETKSYNGKYFKIKDKLAVMPELVGGNNITSGNPIKVVYNKAAESSTAVNTGTGTSLRSPSIAAEVLNLLGGSELAKEKKAIDDGKIYSGAEDLNGLAYHMDVYTFTNGELGRESGNPEVGDRAMSWTFWDNTDDTVQGTNSSYCHVRITDLVVDVVDTTPPVAKILPFFWNDKDDCSVPLDVNEMPLGHIDLEDPSSADADCKIKPQVSGRVIVRGETYDATRLGALYMISPGTDEDFQVAEYKGGKWITAAKNSAGKIEYMYMDGTVIPEEDAPTFADSWPSNWYGFEITSATKPSQDGHTVDWNFTIDMTGYGVAKEKPVIAYAGDAATTPNVSGKNETVQTGSTKDSNDEIIYTSLYKMDFVPYIKGVVGATRSRLGKYPVQAGSKVQLEIMNAKAGDKVTVNFYKSTSTGKQSLTTNATVQKDIVATDGGIVTITAPEKSCFVEATVSSVKTKNNTNLNEKWNIEEGDWKKGDQKKGKNYWTDDRYLSVWNVSSVIGNSAKPINGLIKKVPDHIRRKVFNAKEAIDNKTPSQVWATWASTDDLQIYDDIIGDSHNTTGVTLGINQATFYEPIPTLDVCTINNIPYYVALDNYITGNSANEWGAGLFFGRAGFEFSKQTFNGSASGWPNIIEFQGKDNNRNSSSGYDSKKQQFLNAHITGYAAGGTHYVYASYYDSYARCLKYAAFSEDAVTDTKDGLKWLGQKWGDSGVNATAIATTAQDMDGGKTVVAGWDTLVTNENNFKEEAGEWNDIMMDGTIPVIIYYNKTKKSIEIARAKNAITSAANAPSSGNLHTADGWTSDKTETGWTKTKEIKPSGVGDFGRYLSASMDSSGNIHVSAQDVSNGRVYYLYLTKAGEKYKLEYYSLVDATDAVGNWTDIELSTPGATGFAAGPVISYLNKSKINTAEAVKVAWIESYDTVSKTAVWEAMTDAAMYESGDARTSIVPNPCENYSATESEIIKDRIAVGFNANQFAVDFLRGE